MNITETLDEVIAELESTKTEHIKAVAYLEQQIIRINEKIGRIRNQLKVLKVVNLREMMEVKD